MPHPTSRLATFLAELKRRQVFRVAAAYGGVAFIISEIIANTFEYLGVPVWIIRTIIILLITGFPIAIVLGWIYDITDKGVVRTKSREETIESEIPLHIVIGNKTLAVIAVLAIIVAVWALQREPPSTANLWTANPTIAVLPFTNENLDPEMDYFSYSFQNLLISELNHISGLNVRSQQSTLQFRGSTLSMPEIAAALQADILVEGGALLVENQVRVTAQLIHGASDEHLWSNEYEGILEDILSLQKTIAGAIASEIGLVLTPEQEAYLASATQVNPDAFDSYMMGKYLWENRQDQQDIVNARGLLENAIKLDDNLLSAKLQLGQTYRETGDYGDAIKIFNEVFEQSRAIGDKISEFMSLSGIGDTHLARGRYDEALLYYEQSLVSARNLRDKLSEQSILRNMGSAYYYKDENDSALKYYKESLEIAIELENRRAEGEAHHNLASVYLVTGDYDNAMDSYIQSLRIFKELDDKSQESLSIIGFGIIYARTGNFDTAMAYLAESLEMAREISDRRSEINSLINIGEIHIQLGLDDEALEYYQQALEIAQAIGDTYIEGISWTKLGELMVRKGNYAESFQYFNSGCIIWRYLDFPSYNVWVLSWWALSEMIAGNLEEGSRRAAQVETLLTETHPDQEYVITVDWNLSQVYLGIGDTAKAKIYIQKAYTEVMSRAERFTDQKDKNAFLENIIENRDVISAYQRFSEQGG